MSSINKKYLWIGSAVVLAGAAVWYLSQDREDVKFDPKIHDKKLL